MTLPKQLAIVDHLYMLDGGTTTFLAVDETGGQHGITLAQHMSPHASRSAEEIPGRLYFDGDLIPMRSDQEAKLLALLRAAETRYGGGFTTEGDRYGLSADALILGDDLRRVMANSPEQNTSTLLTEVVQFVESDEYVQFAERVEKAEDESRYTVWAAWEPATRNQVLVRLASVLGIGIPAARDMLAAGTPLAEDVSALDVEDLFERFSTEGIPLRVEPTYRWRLP